MHRREFLALPFALAASADGRLYDVRAHGAAGDAKTKDTDAIQRAIDACTASGGGIVYLPPGTRLSVTIVLKDNVTFHLEAGATLLGSTDLADYRLQSALRASATPTAST